MASRLYLTRTLQSFTPTLAGAWDQTTVTTGSLSPQKDTNAKADVQQAETSANADHDVILTRHVSAPLTAVQTIAGTVDLMVSAFESNADADMVYHVHLWVTQGDTSTPRGTLLTDYIDTGNEWPTTQAGLAMAQQTVASVAAQVGDRIVLELGYRAQNTTTSSRTGRISHGGNSATDLTAADTDTTHPAWIEFSHDIEDNETRIDWQQKWYPGGTADNETATPPAIRGAWTTTTSAGIEALLPTTPGGSSAVLQLTAGGTDANRTRLLNRFVSGPLNAGTIPAGDERITGICLEAAADQDLVFCQHLYLMAKNGDVRATLLNLAADPDTDNEFPITTAAGRQSDLFAVAETTIEQDDRLVLELGFKQLGTPAASGNGTIRRGGAGADAQVGDTDTTKPTWITVGGEPVTAQRGARAVWVGL